MSSLLRRRQRKRSRVAGSFTEGDRPYRVERGGYSTLHPTKGWQRVSQRRVLAQTRLSYMLQMRRFVFGDIRG